MLSHQTLVSSVFSRGNEAQRAKGGGKARDEGEGKPPCTQRGPQIANPLSTASFSRLSGRRGGGQGMGVPYSAGAVIRETRPKMQAKKADKKEECQQERGQGHRSGNARKCASRTLARANRPVVLASGIDDSESQLRRDSVGTSGTISLCSFVPCAQPRRIANSKSKNRGRPSLTPQIPGLSRAIVLPPLTASEQSIHASQARTQPQLFLSSLPPDSVQGLPLLNPEVYSDRQRAEAGIAVPGVSFCFAPPGCYIRTTTQVGFTSLAGLSVNLLAPFSPKRKRRNRRTTYHHSVQHINLTQKRHNPSLGRERAIANGVEDEKKAARQAAWLVFGWALGKRMCSSACAKYLIQCVKAEPQADGGLCS
ncbi:hypothetical protein HDV62DRAFT_378781 [Trichoderma sp. SZMC 28011]